MLVCYLVPPHSEWTVNQPNPKAACHTEKISSFVCFFLFTFFLGLWIDDVGENMRVLSSECLFRSVHPEVVKVRIHKVKNAEQQTNKISFILLRCKIWSYLQHIKEIFIKINNINDEKVIIRNAENGKC